MIPLTPSFLIAAASAFVGLREEGDNRGLMIELFLKGVHLPPGMPWCAAFVHHVGKWSHYDPVGLKSSWPLPATGSCERLHTFAKERDILRAEPADGDVFLIWSEVKTRHVHTGVIARVRERGETAGGLKWYDCDTIEGNTNDDGGREGWGVLRRRRRFYANTRDAFIHWADLDQRDRVGDPLADDKRVA